MTEEEFLLMSENDGRSAAVQMAIFAALGCTKIDYRSPRKMDEAAAQIARFVMGELAKYEIARLEMLAVIFGDAEVSR